MATVGVKGLNSLTGELVCERCDIVRQYYDRLSQPLVDRVMMRCFVDIFSTHYKTSALRAGEVTVNTLAGVSRSWWKAVNRWNVSPAGRQLKRQTRSRIDSKCITKTIFSIRYDTPHCKCVSWWRSG